MKIVWLDEVGSTNTWLAGQTDDLSHGTVVAARRQSAGRGQRGNSWESAPGKNITMSLLLLPRHITPRRQQEISEVVAVATTEMLAEMLPGMPVTIKWPNDIYVGDKKIAGILIEHSICGPRIGRTIVGIGLNVNQAEFLSDAPNPVSLRQLTGLDYDVDVLTERLALSITSLFDVCDTPEPEPELHQRYLSRLYRLGVEATYRDPATGTTFRATIEGVEPDGMLRLRHASGALHHYAFKEVAFVI